MIGVQQEVKINVPSEKPLQKKLFYRKSIVHGWCIRLFILKVCIACIDKQCFDGDK